MEPQVPEQTENTLDVKGLIGQTLLIFLILTVVYLIVVLLARDQLLSISQWITESLGGWGIFFVTFTLDMIPLPASLDLLLPLTISWDPWVLLPLLSIASISGGHAAFYLGRYASKWGFIHKWSEKIRIKGEGVVKRYGFWAVVIAAITPLPFSATCWIAGMARLGKRAFFLASLFRIPRIVIFYFGILWGLSFFKVLV